MTSCFEGFCFFFFFLNSFYFAPDCFILLIGRDLLTRLGGHCFLSGKRKEQIKSEIKMEALVDPGMWNIKVLDLAKDIQSMTIK